MDSRENGNRNIKLIIEYDGTGYHGWQSQNNASAVQDIVNDAVSKVVCHPVNLTGASRTDAGVHAVGQVVNFFTSSSIPVEKIPFAVNAYLPDDIVVKGAVVVSDSFHSRFSTKGKRYRYIINNSKFPSALMRNREYFCPYNLDRDLMRIAAQVFVGEHDFKGFMAVGGQAKDTVRTIFEADIKTEQDRIVFEVRGNGFLYNMVRIMAGTLIDIGRGKLSIEDLHRVMNDGDRSKAGMTVPPQGLYLVEVYY